MTAIAVLGAVNAAMTLVEQLIPVIEQLHITGEISADVQQGVLSRYQEMKTNLDAKFSGPEWQIAP